VLLTATTAKSGREGNGVSVVALDLADAGQTSDAGTASRLDGNSRSETTRATYSTDPGLSTRSSTTMGPAATEGEIPPPAAGHARSQSAGNQGAGRVITLDFEYGFNPAYDAAPMTFGVGTGFRSLIGPMDPIGPSARVVVLTAALVDARNERTGQRNQSALWGGSLLFGDLDLYGRLSAGLRLGVSTRLGVYFAPRLYPLVAVGVGMAADVGKTRLELVARLQPLPTSLEITAVRGEEVWARTRWMVVPTLHLSLPIEN
jgi:hypothetical protein